MYYAASSAMTNEVVTNLREFFADYYSYSYLMNRNYTLFGRPVNYGPRNEQVYLLSSRFPDRFNLYPRILVNVSLQRLSRVQADNLILQIDEVNQYGRRDVKGYIKGGFLTVNVSVTVEAMDQTMTEEITDLIAWWSTNNGWEYFKKLQWFIEPMAATQISPVNYSEGNTTTRVYRSSLNTTMRGTWLRFQEEPAQHISAFNIEQNYIDSQREALRVDKILDGNDLLFVDEVTASASMGAFSDVIFTESVAEYAEYTASSSDLLALITDVLHNYTTSSSQTDSFTLSSQLQFELNIPVSQTDSITFGSEIIEQFLATLNFTEALSVTDAVTAQYEFVRTINDGFSFITPLVIALYETVVTQTDDVAFVTQGLLTQFLGTDSRSSTFSFSDLLASLAEYTTTFSDTLAFSDSRTAFVEGNDTRFDSFTIFDTSVVTQAEYIQSHSETVSLSEAVTSVADYTAALSSSNFELTSTIANERLVVHEPLGLLISLTYTEAVPEEHHQPVGITLAFTDPVADD